MTGYYAIKSMVLIDFIDVSDIAIAEPFSRRAHQTDKLFIFNELRDVPRSGFQRPGAADCSLKELEVPRREATCGKSKLHLGQNSKHLHGYIIRATALQSQLHQGLTTLCRCVAASRVRQLFLGDYAPKAVRAEQQVVAIL